MKMKRFIYLKLAAVTMIFSAGTSFGANKGAGLFSEDQQRDFRNDDAPFPSFEFRDLRDYFHLNNSADSQKSIATLDDFLVVAEAPNAEVECVEYSCPFQMAGTFPTAGLWRHLKKCRAIVPFIGPAVTAVCTIVSIDDLLACLDAANAEYDTCASNADHVYQTCLAVDGMNKADCEALYAWDLQICRSERTLHKTECYANLVDEASCAKDLREAWEDSQPPIKDLCRQPWNE